MRKAFEIYGYAAPLVLFPAAVWLWWRHYDGSWPLVAIAVGAHQFVRFHRSRGWPVVSASIVEREPSSLFERDARPGMHYVNLDSDHFLEYEVDGERFSHRIQDEANIRVAGFKVWRRKPERQRVSVRYNPENPSDYIRADQAAGSGVMIIALGLVLAFCAAVAPHLEWRESGGTARLHWVP